MLPLLIALLISGWVGFYLASLAVARLRRAMLTLWTLAPSTFFLGKTVAEGGIDMMLPSLPWAIIVFTGWGGAALLSYFTKRPRRRLY